MGTRMERGRELANATVGQAERRGNEQQFQRPLIETETAVSGVKEAVIMHALQLSRAYREVFILCDIQGRSVPEAAFILGLDPTTVTSRLEHARRQMCEVTNGLRER
jgi:DNA-directed RNA polymerase specialized sigma24 family protein